jgi:hypothetical protein
MNDAMVWIWCWWRVCLWRVIAKTKTFDADLLRSDDMFSKQEKKEFVIDTKVGWIWYSLTNKKRVLRFRPHRFYCCRHHVINSPTNDLTERDVRVQIVLNREMLFIVWLGANLQLLWCWRSNFSHAFIQSSHQETQRFLVVSVGNIDWTVLCFLYMAAEPATTQRRDNIRFKHVVQAGDIQKLKDLHVRMNNFIMLGTPNHRSLISSDLYSLADFRHVSSCWLLPCYLRTCCCLCDILTVGSNRYWLLQSWPWLLSMKMTRWV